ncbi:MAG TPA: hypothetical protein VL500_00335 [Candidatus Eisenbacteria bacterium]|jgi:hypothetical protein|nr:hypothetical protein [Candidatus Eisenbacteria bacterium]
MPSTSFSGHGHRPAAAAVLDGRSSQAALRVALVAAAGLVVMSGIFLVTRPVQAGIGDIFALGIAWIFNIFTGWVGQLLLIVVSALIWVAQYNGFVTSPPVANGWSIVRDVTNMFFILVLLVIAFGTILGVDAYSYKNKMLSRLLIMAVVVNFSRTICGLLIDFAQVVMLTFVYGFKEAAGGNFADALRITSLMQDRASGIEETVSAWSIAVAMILAFFMVLIALVVVILMTITLAIRIVYLWLLVVLSPLAFFLKAVPGGSASGYYGMWWKMFTGQVIVGPVMAFFLWLSLVSVASNQLTSNGFPSAAQKGAGAEVVSGSITEAFQDSEIEAFIIAICLLMGGLQLSKQISSESAGAAPGIAKKAASLGMRAAKGIGRGAANATGVTAGYNAAKDKVLSAGTRVPLVSTAAGRALGEHRQKMGSAGADNAKWLNQLTPDERKRATRSVLPDAMLSPEARGLKKEALRADVKEMAEKGAKTDAEKKEFFDKRSKLESLGSRMGDKSVATDVKGLYKKRPDLIVNEDERDPNKMREQRNALKRAAASLSAKDVEDMEGNALTSAVLANMNPNALLGSRDALRQKLGDMPESSRGGMKTMLDSLDAKEKSMEEARDKDGNRLYNDKQIARELRGMAEGGQGSFRADSVKSLTDEDRANYFGTLNKEQLANMPAEALGTALVAAASSAGSLSGNDLSKLSGSMDRMAQALANQPQAIEKLPSALKEQLRDSLISSGADAPLAVLAAGGTADQAFKGYDNAKLAQFMGTGENASVAAKLVNPSRLVDKGGANPLTAQMLMKLDVESVSTMAREGNGDAAYGVITAAEQVANAKAEDLAGTGMAADQIKLLQERAKGMLEDLAASGNMRATSDMKFTGQAMSAISSKLDKAMGAPGRAVEAAVEKIKGKVSSVKEAVERSNERVRDTYRKGKRTVKRF